MTCRRTLRDGWGPHQLRVRRLIGYAYFAYPQFLRYRSFMTPDPKHLDAVHEALKAAVGLDPDDALPHLREAADRLTELIDESMAEAVLQGKASLRSAGAAAGLTENAVPPRLARTQTLGAYANEEGRVTAAGVERAKYDHESGTPRPAPAPAAAPMRFKPRRPS